MASIQERVAAGIAWLNENHPGWVEKINLETLDIGSGCTCIVGQIGDLESGSINRADAMMPLGMFGLGDLGPYYADCAALTAEWRERITELKNRGPRCQP